MSLGTPPGENASPSEWIGWYRWCAERVDLFDAVDREQVRRPEVLAAMEKLMEAATPRRPLPDVVVPSLLEWYALDGAMMATAYSAYDMDALPADLFGFLARLDGKTPWSKALGSEVGIDEGLVLTLWERGLLVAPDEGFREGMTSVAFRDGPWSALPEFKEHIAASLEASLSGKAKE